MTHDHDGYQAGQDIGERGVAADELRSYIERIETLDESAKALNDDRKEIYVEAKNRGFNTKAIKRIIALRRIDESERQEQETIVELYKSAIGMA